MEKGHGNLKLEILKLQRAAKKYENMSFCIIFTGHNSRPFKGLGLGLKFHIRNVTRRNTK